MAASFNTTNNSIKITYMDENGDKITKTYSNVKNNVTAAQVEAFQNYVRNLTSSATIAYLVTTQELEEE